MMHTNSSLPRSHSAGIKITGCKFELVVLCSSEAGIRRYDMAAIEHSMTSQKNLDPTDLSFLISHMRELRPEARKYLTWAAFFGETFVTLLLNAALLLMLHSFKVTEVALMMAWEDSSGSSGSDDEMDDMWNLHKAVTNLQQTGSNNARGSIRGLQMALDEGWLIQRARDMCSFAHDRYRQAARAEVDALPADTIEKMSFRVRQSMRTGLLIET